ncbi:MAG: heparan-alpha-glucosaminide N-acetyltransferase domain-containing protein, partial [Actinomycetota bacterium]
MTAQPALDPTAAPWPAPTGPPTGGRRRSGPPAGAPPQRRQTGRITGIDLARGLAMAGMVVVHFVSRFQQPDHDLTELAALFHGRAMPLFMLLGGVGVTLLTARSATPDRDLAIRAVLLLGLGLVLTEYIDRLAIVLPSYGLLFVLAMAARRLPSAALLAAVLPGPELYSVAA